MNTLIVNLFGGPSSGKSSFAYGIMWRLKAFESIECEMAPEYAKDVVFEESPTKLSNQIYIFGKQHNRVHRLLGKVQVIVTDSPLLLSIVYDKNNKKAFKELILDEYRAYNTLNILINRTHPYSEVGRYQKENEAIEVHKKIFQVLNDNKIKFHEFNSMPADTNLDKIIKLILNNINELN